MKSKVYVGIALAIALVMFASIIGFGLLPDYLSGNGGSAGSVIADVKTQKFSPNPPTVNPPQTDTTTTTPTITPPNTSQNSSANSGQVTQPAPVTTPPIMRPIRVTRAS